jgi:hypothetical protein
MESPMEIWDDIEDAWEKLRIKRRQITGGDIEDDIVLKGKSIVYLSDEAFELAEDTLTKVLTEMDKGFSTRKRDQRIEELEDDLKELISILNEKRRMITQEKLEHKVEEVWDDIEERFERIIGKGKEK